MQIQVPPKKKEKKKNKNRKAGVRALLLVSFARLSPAAPSVFFFRTENRAPN